MKNLLIITCLLIMCMPGISLADYMYLDNFNKGDNRNLNDGGSGIDGGVTEVKYNSKQNPFGNSGCSLCLTYDVSSVGGAFWMNLTNGAVPMNFTNYNYLSFWVKGENGGEGFKVQLEDSVNTGGTQFAFLHINNYLEGGEITTSWQKVVIPVQSFDPNKPFDLTKVKAMQFAFDNGLGINNSKVYIDELLFSTGTSPIYIDNMEFDEKAWLWDDLDALKWTINAGTNGGGGVYSYRTNTLNTDHTNYLGQGSYKCDHYRGGDKAFTAWQLGASGILYLDISACDKVQFYIKSRYTRVGGEGPKIYIDDTGYDNFINMPYIDNNWRLVETNLSAFEPVFDKTKILNFRLNTDSGTASSNSFWVDEIKFIDTIPPQAPTNIYINGVKLTNNFIFDEIDIAITSTLSSNESSDPSLEAVMAEYRVNNEDWQIINFDYDTAGTNFTNIWKADGLSSQDKVDLKISSIDCSGNKSSVIFTNCQVPSSAFIAYSKMFQDSPVEDGLSLCTAGTYYTNNIGGSGARRTKEPWASLTFDVSAGFAETVIDDTYYFVLAIEYYDIGTNTRFFLEYDNRENLSAGTNSKSVTLPKMDNSLTWKTNYVYIYDAYWGDRVSGAADFLIKGEDIIYVREVILYRVSSSASAVSLRLSASDSEMGVGTLNKITVEAINDFGFPAIKASGTVNVSVVNGSAILSKENVSLVNGIGYFYISNSIEETVNITAVKSGLDSGFYSVVFELFYGLNKSKNVSITLGNPVIRNGIYEYVETDPTFIGGEHTYQTPDIEWGSMLFDIDSDFIYNRNENDGYIYDITIEYYDIYTSTDDDENKKYLLLFYDNIGSPDIGPQGWYDPKECDQKIVRQNSKTWKTFTFSIMDPLFYDRIDGRGDFILKAYDPIYIKSVLVSKRNYYHLQKNEDLKIESANANLFIEKNSTLANHYIIPFNLLALPDTKIPLYGMAYSINNKSLVSGCDFLAFNENRSKLDNLYLKKTAQLELLYKIENLSSEINENNLSIYFYNNVSTVSTEKDKWEKKGGNLDTTLKKLSLNVNHLSLYGVFESNSGKDFLIQWEYNPFSPNNDGIMDRGFLHVVLPENVKNLRVFIYNLKGAFVKELPKQQTSTGQIFEWDGKNQRNKRVPIGPYIYQVEYDDKVYNGIVGVVR